MNATIFTGNLEYWHLKPTKSFKTLETEYYRPQTILNDTIQVEYMPQNDSKAVIAKIKWKPTTGEMTYSCLLTLRHIINDQFSINFQI